MEKVLAIKSNEKGMIQRNGSNLPILDCDKFFFIEKKIADTLVDYKQLIPYVVIIDKETDKVMWYNRKGGEKRLHNLVSIGVGGHVNINDSPSILTDDINRFVQEMILNALKREVEEEVGIYEFSLKDLTFKGIIDLNDTEVDKMHLGFLFTLYTDKKIESTEEIEKAYFDTPKNISQMNLETWSVEAIKKIFDFADL